jgi:hypothetical protein
MNAEGRIDSSRPLLIHPKQAAPGMVPVRFLDPSPESFGGRASAPWRWRGEDSLGLHLADEHEERGGVLLYRVRKGRMKSSSMP